MNTDYKDVNDNKIEFVGQTNATVKTNKTLQLPLLITRANITPLMGLDWKNRLANPIGFKFPSFCFCHSVAPNPLVLASVVRIFSLFGL